MCFIDEQALHIRSWRAARLASACVMQAAADSPVVHGPGAELRRTPVSNWPCLQAYTPSQERAAVRASVLKEFGELGRSPPLPNYPPRKK
jgi:hypothetical protein